MKHFLFTLWHYDFAQVSSRMLSKLAVPTVILLVGFGAYDVALDTGSSLFNYFTDLLAKGTNPLSSSLDAHQFAHFAYGIFVCLALYISAFSAITFVMSMRRYGRERFAAVFLPHFLSNLVAMAASTLLTALLGLIALALDHSFGSGFNILSQGYDVALKYLQGHVPTIAPLPYPLALFMGTLLGGLPGYAAHWLAHQSRLIWYCAHRCHHSAEIMHPIGVGPFMFLPELFGNLPTILIAAVATKLFYYEPLLPEVVILGVLGIVVEKFNHCTVTYDFAFRNPLVRGLGAYFGGGVYHYMHHTSKPGDEIVNIGGAPFLLWDRLFGTYRTPPATAPRVGLTKNPHILLNPFAIILSGWQQIAYELRANRDWKTRFLILFGTVHFAPPVSRDYLILGYPDGVDAQAEADHPLVLQESK
jgi:sterol desaturase/sphingolipid hydroxylase (fatty acid hydroxylase superfamily)